ncbi:hypothetical protein ACA910_008201 [Epithemia clementina (nom. ined.)]
MATAATSSSKTTTVVVPTPSSSHDSVAALDSYVSKKESPSSFSLPLPPLVPLRINVVSSDQTVRIVDTLLCDLSLIRKQMMMVTCDSNNSSCNEANRNCIKVIAYDFANHVLSDLEVQGMSRTARHFTGRVELWNAKALQLIQTQIQDQLETAIDAYYSPDQQELRRHYKRRRVEAMFPNTYTTDDTALSPSNAKDEEDVTNINESQMQPGDAVSVQTRDKSETTNPYGNNVKQEASFNEPTARESESGSTKAPLANDVPDDVASFSTDDRNQRLLQQQKQQQKLSLVAKKSPRPSIIPIRLRLILSNNIRIHDDFEWDCSLQDVYTPLQMASDLARDLNLNDDAVLSIAVEITEQIVRASSFDNRDDFRQSVKAMSSSSSASGDYLGWNEDAEQLFQTLQQRHKESKAALMLLPPSSAKDISATNTTAAWETDARDHVTHSTFMVAQLKPTPFEK